MNPNHDSPQNPTLSPIQVTALEALLSGKSIVQASSLAGVDRSTVHTWLRSDYVFIAAYNDGRRQILEEMQARLLALAEKATAVIDGALGQGDAKAALAILKGLGLLTGEPPKVGPTDPEGLETDPEVLEAAKAQSRLFDRLAAGLVG